MRTRNTLFFFLFLALVTGTFASVARNDYGLRLVTFACLGLAATIAFFLFQRFKKTAPAEIVESAALMGLFILLALRASYIYFPFAEHLAVGVSAILSFFYLYRCIKTYKGLANQNKFLGISLGLYYLSITFFTAALAVRALTAGLAPVAVTIGAAALSGFLVMAVIRKKHLLAGEETTVWSYVGKLKDHSFYLVVGFFCMWLFMAGNSLGVVPPLYTGTVPGVYVELVEKAESGEENPKDGQYDHDRYREAMEKFLERHGKE